MKLSVCMITFNHGQFIGQAIDSALAQRTSFPYEIVIGEDCSTDGTRECIAGFQREHPETIRALFREKNIGISRNLIQTLQACRGEYVALLEGDDYWTDVSKLQTQVDFLERRPDYVMCFHRVRTLYADGNRRGRALPGLGYRSTLSLDDLVMVGNFIPTCSVVFRNGLNEEFPEWLFDLRIADYPLHILNARHGRIGYLKRLMATYRVHSSGSFSSRSNAQRVQEVVRMYDHINAQLGFRYDRSITALQSYWQAVEYYRNGEIASAQACAARRLAAPPLNRQSVMALLMLYASPIYRLVRALNPIH